MTGHSERIQSDPMTAMHVPSERLQLADAVGQRVDGELNRPQRCTTVSVLGLARQGSAGLQRCVSSDELREPCVQLLAFLRLPVALCLLDLGDALAAGASAVASQWPRKIAAFGENS